MRKAIGIIFLLVYIIILGKFAFAEYFYQSGKAKKDIKKLKLAAVLNPFVSDYWYQIYDLSEPKDISSIKEAIRWEPLKAAYHMYFALELMRDNSRRTLASDRIAYHEIKRAYELKPYSDTYRQIYEQYAKPYLIDINQ